jgi:hypothetical protein
MSGYKSLDELEIVLRSGAGIAIICEGEDYREDEFFYKEWFGDLGRMVTFHAQDGWEVRAGRRQGAQAARHAGARIWPSGQGFHA